MKAFNVIIVGCGAIAFRWLDHLTKRDDTEIKAIVETNLVRAQQAKDQYGLHCNLYMSLDEALEKEQCN
ncbi:MAG: Gfo/Idh/MocA family oxidoreductase, partial [Clostridiales bacterium]|nr:Gfo/Idh/MocA family oxidoreductase [Clostridiales bacterium]